MATVERLEVRTAAEGNTERLGREVARLREMGADLAVGFRRFIEVRDALHDDGIDVTVELQPWMMAALDTWRRENGS